MANCGCADGDRVRAGDILIRLDETQTKAAASIITKNVDEFMARQARLETERDGLGEVVFPASLLERARQPNSRMPPTLSRRSAVCSNCAARRVTVRSHS